MWYFYNTFPLQTRSTIKYFGMYICLQALSLASRFVSTWNFKEKLIWTKSIFYIYSFKKQYTKGYRIIKSFLSFLVVVFIFLKIGALPKPKSLKTNELRKQINCKQTSNYLAKKSIFFSQRTSFFSFKGINIGCRVCIYFCSNKIKIIFNSE